MADATSTVRVNIIGDAKKLSSALKESDKGLAGFGKTLLAGAAAGLSIKGAFDFAAGAIGEADRLGDATARLEGSLGKVDAKKVEDLAGSFLKIGLSSQDVLELSAGFVDIGTASGIAAPKLAEFAPQVAATAQAMSLLGMGDAATLVDAIGKAAGGATKPLKDLGISIDEAAVKALAYQQTGKPMNQALTEGELAGARLTIIMEKLKPKLDAATEGSGDLEQKQGELQARVEELQGKLGGPLSEALADVVGFINDEIEAIPHAIDGWAALGNAILHFAETVAAPLGNVRDLLENIANLAGTAAPRIIPRDRQLQVTGFGRTGTSERSVVQATTNNNLRNRVGGP